MLKYIICSLLAGFFFSCSSSSEQKKQTAVSQTLAVTDEMGRVIQVPLPVQRILPLCASSEEVMVLLCDSSKIVGRTPECSFPQWILQKPIVNNYPLDIEKVISLKPDFIVSKEGMISMDQVKKMESLGIPVYIQRADDIKGIAHSMQQLGQAIGQKERGTQAARYFQYQFDSLANIAHSKAPAPSAIGLISSDPIYVFGTSSYFTDVLHYCGLINAVDSSITQAFPVVDQEYLLKADPDYLIFPGEQKQTEELFVKFPVLKKMKAYRLHHCLYINGDWLSRPGPQLINAAIAIHQQVTLSLHEKR